MSIRIMARVLLAALACAPLAVLANSYPELETNRLNRPSDSIGAIGNDLFGEQVDFYNGQTSFAVTDISIPGTGRIPVSLGRVLNVVQAGQDGTLPGFENWELDVPYLTGNFAEIGWVVGNNASDHRCSVTDVAAATPSTVTKGETSFAAHEYWSGYTLHVSGAGSQEMLLANTSAPNISPHPDDGNTYYWVTKSQWALSCHSSIQSGGTGEGFLAVAPDGTKYYFDRMMFVSGNAADVSKTWSFHDEIHNITKYIEERYSRRRYYLAASHAVDRFGNTVTWTYDANNQLQSIAASDGRTITLTWTAGHVSTATDGAQTWTYDYTPYTSNPDDAYHASQLTGVVQPDGSRWSYRYDGNLALVDTSPPAKSQTGEPEPQGQPGCNGVPIPLLRQSPYASDSYTLTATHPSGASGVFQFKTLIRGLSYDPYKCTGVDPTYPKETEQFAIFSKVLSGPSMPTSTWTFSYSGTSQIDHDSSWAADCPDNSCPDTVWTKVLNPDGTEVQSTFGNRYGVTEGQLQDVKVFADSSEATVLDETTSTYWTYADGQPFPEFIGTTVNPRERAFLTEEQHPQLTHTQLRDGVAFQSKVNTFDAYASPLSTTRWSSCAPSVPDCGMPGFRRTDVATHDDNTTLWVLGQPATLTNADTGVQVYQRTYDPATALPTTVTSFGRLAARYTFLPDGNLHTVTDGNDHTTTLDDYFRGVPQALHYPDGTTRTAKVDAFGHITSITDPIGASPADDQKTTTTTFGYDAMGRLNRITPPRGDEVAWKPTTIAFAPVATAEYGLSPGHWKQTVRTGNAVSVTYFDGLWQPVLSQTYDAANVSGTQRFATKAFDFAGRTTFASSPVAAVGQYDDALTGVHTAYDGLGRPTTSTQDSELGPLTTHYDYLPGFITQTTNPRNYVTGTAYQVFDAPDTSHPTAIVSPEGVTTTIARDVFGKPLSITRSGTWQGSPISATRSYVYDSQQRLCKRVEPETGASFVAYDAANNVAWTAAGSTLTALDTPSQCEADRDAVPASSRTLRSYDARDRVLAVNIPGSSDDLTYRYFNDGALRLLTTGSGANAIVWSYTYDKRRLPLTETLNLDGRSKTIRHAYDAYGHARQLTYPDGLAINTLPNVLGQPTQAGVYATDVSYFPNGGMRGFTYHNGIVHSLTQNTRGLPQESKDALGTTAILDDTYSYDANGNVAAIADGTTYHGDNRTMEYDGLDRLTTTRAPNQWWVSATTTYDALDNIRSNQVGDNPKYLNTFAYDPASWRLTGIAGHVNWALSYDARGNVTGKGAGQDAYVFDAANRMTAVTGKESYRYDGYGRRVKVTRTIDGKIDYPVYDRGGQLLTEDDGRSNQTTDYVSLNGSLVAKRSAAIGSAKWATTYEHTDALHSPTDETDSKGNLKRATLYTPYGEPGGGQYVQGPGYTGHVTDAATRLTYAQQRYYDPVMGRFLSTDPVQASDTGASFNRYWYANNNPYRFTDPDGRSTCANPTCTMSTIDSHPGVQKGYAPSVNGNEGLPQGNVGRGIASANSPGPTITFINDNPHGASPNQPVTTATAKMVESGVVNSGVQSVNINSTTGGRHAATSNHPRGKAVDINRVNGMRVGDPANRSAVTDVQKSFRSEPNVRENFGPAFQEKSLTSGATPVPWTQVGEEHQNHIHESGQQ